jgi:hypothetical protein
MVLVLYQRLESLVSLCEKNDDGNNIIFEQFEYISDTKTQASVRVPYMV